MLSILYFAAMTKAHGPYRYEQEAVEVCFDLEAGNREYWGDDEVNEDTVCNICTRVKQNGRWITSKKCKAGVKNGGWGTERDCIDTEENYDVNAVEFYVQTDCGDGMWLDRLQVKTQEDRKLTRAGTFWGKNNNKGWCLSTEAGDHGGFGDAKTNGKCYQTLKFYVDSKGDRVAAGWQAGGWQPTFRRLAPIETRLAGTVLDLTTTQKPPVPGSEDPEVLDVFTEGEALAVPMAHQLEDMAAQLEDLAAQLEDLAGFTEGEPAVPMAHD